MGGLSRRGFLGSLGLGGLALFDGIVAVPTASAAGADAFGALLPPDANGLSLPPGFSSRIVASTPFFVGDTSHPWHLYPDGGATFATGDGGWVYVSNSESGSQGGVGAIRFAVDGSIADAYKILSGTSTNCAGGPTPWGTWLSCEEATAGRVYECDPFTPGSQGVARPALGVFRHEAAAVDPVHHHVYLTEDQGDGLLYRFTPDVWPSLDSGLLEAARIVGVNLVWQTVPDPSAASVETRDQLPTASHFVRGEGCWYEAGFVYVCTNGDDRVWRIETASQTIAVLYDFASSASPLLAGVDNVFAAPNGDIYVAEDGGNLEVVALTAAGDVKPIVRLDADPLLTEITGPALSPDGTRLYFSSQRPFGTTYEVTGPFLGSPVASVGWVARGLMAAAMALLARR